MHFRQLEIEGLVLVEMTPHFDERGSFSRSFCEREFADAGLPERFVQHNLSFNCRAGTVRGMHYTQAPVQEHKLVRCTVGKIWDTIVDLRPHSPTYLKSLSIELSPTSRTALFIPVGFAHGFQTLVDGTEVMYLMGCAYEPSAARGIRWNDPAIDINWPLPISVISERDASYCDLDVATGGGAI